MAVIQCIGVVSESDYGDFSSLCIRSLSGDNYGAFLENLAEQRRKLTAIGVTTIDVNIDVSGFRIWLKGRVGTPQDLNSYATSISNK